LPVAQSQSLGRANVSGGITVIGGVLVVALAILKGGAAIAEKKQPPGAPAH